MPRVCTCWVPSWAAEARSGPQVLLRACWVPCVAVACMTSQAGASLSQFNGAAFSPGSRAIPHVAAGSWLGLGLHGSSGPEGASRTATSLLWPSPVSPSLSHLPA